MYTQKNPARTLTIQAPAHNCSYDHSWRQHNGASAAATRQYRYVIPGTRPKVDFLAGNNTGRAMYYFDLLLTIRANRRKGTARKLSEKLIVFFERP
jgi:hypothetical protein